MMKQHILYYIITFSAAFTPFLEAQQPVKLETAVNIALANNAKIRVEEKRVDYQRALIHTAKTLDATQVTAELGQFNSAFFDTGFGISQSFQLPGVYTKRSQLNRQKVLIAEAYQALTEKEIRQQMDELFAEYRYLNAKTRLLRSQDSLFDNFRQKAELRWQKGETDILEKTTAEQQKINISQQLAMAEQMKQYLLISLDWLINDGKNYVPDVAEFGILTYNVLLDSVAIQSHPVLLAAAREINVAKTAVQVEKTALWPTFSAGYRNVGIRGTGADNIVYNASDRFSSVQIGIGIPVFRKGIQASIQGAQLMEAVKEKEYASKMQEMNIRVQQEYILYNETIMRITTYQQTALPNARTIRSVSDKKFANGEINYLEFVMLTNQAIQIENEYLEMIRNVNGNIINLYYLGSH